MKTTISNDSHLLKEISKKLLEDLREKAVEEEVLFDIHVAFEEALRNAMIHGNKLDPAKKVIVETDITEDKVRICVEDEGPGFEPEDVPDPTLDENLLKEGGRGVYLIKYLMDEVKYENGARRINMVKYLRDKRS